MVGRLGGDEFCVYVSNLSKAKMIEKADKIGKDIAALSISGHTMFHAVLVSRSVKESGILWKHILRQTKRCTILKS